jgi:DNA polymerase-3 subunit gamma/tau
VSYLPLARKYRPSSFQQLVGQDAVAKALGNAIKLKREPHGLILSGVRGIGKTTTARLYAKSLNCDKGPSAEPCDSCDSCKAIAAGFHEDVIEIDGASNTGVGDVRALQETVEYVPQRSPYKVYIIDEVHMLSQAAFNALLKTLEEPPAHVVFVFATTELHKVPQTIISRCQTFYLQKHTLQNIRDRLVYILGQEGLEFEEAAVAMVARAGQGSMRDALTLLDQAIALGEGRVTVASLEPLLSGSQAGAYLTLLGALVHRDSQAVMQAIDAFDQAGAEFPDMVAELAAMARHGFVLRDLGADALDTALLGLDDGDISRLQEISSAAGEFDLNRIFRTLVQCQSELDGSELDRFILENYCFEWCLDPGLPDLSQLIAKGPAESGATQSGQGQMSPALGVRPKVPNSSADRMGARPATQASSMAAIREELQAQRHPNRAPSTKRPQALDSQPESNTAGDDASDIAAASGHKVASVNLGSSVLPSARNAGQNDQIAPMSPLKGPETDEKNTTAPPAASSKIKKVAAPEMARDPRQVAEAKAPDRGETGEVDDLWPVDWRAMVDTWKQRKPLQARKLEEIHPMLYSRERLELKVPEGSFAAQALLMPDEQRKLMEEFRELFGFEGQIVFTTAANAAGEEVAEQSIEPLPDTILSEKEREREAAKQKLADQAISEPLTKEMLAVLGGKIEDVKVFGESVNT